MAGFDVALIFLRFAIRDVALTFLRWARKNGHLTNLESGLHLAWLARVLVGKNVASPLAWSGRVLVGKRGVSFSASAKRTVAMRTI